MDKTSYGFWMLIVVLFSASVFFGLNAEQRRRSFQSGAGKLESGDLVKLVTAVDGDTVQVALEGQEPVTVRLIGIKSFDAKVAKDPGTPFAKAALGELTDLMTRHPSRVMLDATPKDKHGRYLATLFVEDRDIALHLLSRGLVVAYTVHPFPAMPIYLQAQEKAEAARNGLWASAEATQRARAMIETMRTQSP